MHSDKFIEKLNTLDEYDKKLTYNYFTKFEAINNLFEIVLKKKKMIRGSFGNYNAKTVFVVNYDNTNDKIISLIKKYYEINNADFYSIYITSIDKFCDRKLDLTLLSKEIQIINPNRVIVLGDDIDIPNGMSFSKDKLEELLLCLDDKERKENSKIFNTVKDEFTNCIKYALYGGG